MSETVNLTIDGKTLSVPKGTNLIEAAKLAGIIIPHYCYHPDLSIAGNCRMCQVAVKGAPKLTIACNTQVTEGMEVTTNSKEVKDAQSATLEFILINHPLDCTVCDQAGHCKLQDYHFEYNAKPSRFLEEKEHKPKAVPLGPTVMLDGERCIMCTRCIRFCDEVTKTSELGMLNRGDRSVISINPGKELDNPLSGNVVDLCPVGALTHRNWRFNTRIWFTKQVDSVCPGCSTGCNVKVAVRDKQVVQVKAKYNANVNKEWLCDEGRYGFHRFLPEKRVLEPLINGKVATLDEALTKASKIFDDKTAIFLSPDLLFEEFSIISGFIESLPSKPFTCVQYKKRDLSEVEKILVSPDYAGNFKSAQSFGLASDDPGSQYLEGITKLKDGSFSSVWIIGDRGIEEEGINLPVNSVGFFTNAENNLKPGIILPARSILEKSGLYLNKDQRLQFVDRLIDFPVGTEPEWRLINKIAEKRGKKLTDAQSDRDLTLSTLNPEISIFSLKEQGGVRI